MKRKDDKKNPNDFPVVCVGGSAGGLDAYLRLLQNLPATMEMRNNNIYHEKKFVDFFNLTPPQDSIGDVRPINNAIIKFVGAGLPQAYFAEELNFKNASSGQMLYNFLT